MNEIEENMTIESGREEQRKNNTKEIRKKKIEEKNVINSERHHSNK